MSDSPGRSTGRLVLYCVAYAVVAYVAAVTAVGLAAGEQLGYWVPWAVLVIVVAWEGAALWLARRRVSVITPRFLLSFPRKVPLTEQEWRACWDSLSGSALPLTVTRAWKVGVTPLFECVDRRGKQWWVQAGIPAVSLATWFAGPMIYIPRAGRLHGKMFWRIDWGEPLDGDHAALEWNAMTGRQAPDWQPGAARTSREGRLRFYCLGADGSRLLLSDAFEQEEPRLLLGVFLIFLRDPFPRWMPREGLRAAA